MYFADQKSYEEYHSPEQRKIRQEEARKLSEKSITMALALYESGDKAGAEKTLFDAGFQEDGIAYYMSAWRESAPVNNKPKRPSAPGM